MLRVGQGRSGNRVVEFIRMATSSIRPSQRRPISPSPSRSCRAPRTSCADDSVVNSPSKAPRPTSVPSRKSTASPSSITQTKCSHSPSGSAEESFTRTMRPPEGRSRSSDRIPESSNSPRRRVSPSCRTAPRRGRDSARTNPVMLKLPSFGIGKSATSA